MVVMQEAICPFVRSAKNGASSEEPLSLCLRRSTRELHQAVEVKLGLPWTITSRDNYVACLSRFHRLYRPLERQLRAFSDWPDHGLSPMGHVYAASLASDLELLLQPGAPLPPDAPSEACPNLPSFAHALGARYVLEGSTLGGEVILHHLIRSGVDGAATARAFLGVGQQRPDGWRDFRAALDRYGKKWPKAVPHVVTGAERSFRAIGEWLQSSRWKEV